MEENNSKQKSPVEKSSEPGGETPLNEIILPGQQATEPVTISEQPSTNMEAHHHSHVHHSKKWKDYLFEFIMLFLAVSAGFLVENMREHYIEGKRGEAYAKSLYDDLKVDTAILRRTYNEKVWSQQKLDSLEALLTLPDMSPHNEMIYYFERFVTQTDVFTCQDVLTNSYAVQEIFVI